MEKENVEKALTDVLKEIDENKRKFKQSIDFIMVLRPRKNKSETPLDSVLSLPNNGTIIPSWLENYTSTNALWWLKIAAIPGGSSETVYVGFAC